MSTFDRAQVLASILESNRHREELGSTPMNVERELHWREVLHNERSGRNVIGPSKRG